MSGDFHPPGCRCPMCTSVPPYLQLGQQSAEDAGIAADYAAGTYAGQTTATNSPLPTDYAERKSLPLWTFMFEYFPLAWLEVVRVAVDGDKQHGNTGKTIRWAREKSTDQLNTAFRHQFDYGTGAKLDTDGRAHLAKAVWRLMAQLQLDIEESRK